MLNSPRLFLLRRIAKPSGIIFQSTARMADLSKPKPVVTVVQMTSTPDKATFAQLSALVNRAKTRGALMTFLPECADYVSDSRDQAVALAEPLEGPTVSRYRELARSLKMWLSVGGYHEKPKAAEETKRIYNTHLLIDSEGTIQGVYRKVHMFDVDIPGAVPSYESAYTVPGSGIVPPVTTICGKVGMAICYDMRFPEMAISLVQQGAEILTYPSAFTVPTGMAHWETLLRNRAIENQCYVIAAAQIGRHHAKRSSYGNAMVVDHWEQLSPDVPTRPIFASPKLTWNCCTRDAPRCQSSATSDTTSMVMF